MWCILNYISEGGYNVLNILLLLNNTNFYLIINAGQRDEAAHAWDIYINQPVLWTFTELDIYIKQCGLWTFTDPSLFN
jgi:hypothetical protein